MHISAMFLSICTGKFLGLLAVSAVYVVTLTMEHSVYATVTTNNGVLKLEVDSLPHITERLAKLSCFSQFSRVPQKFFSEYLFISDKLRIMALYKCFNHKAP